MDQLARKLPAVAGTIAARVAVLAAGLGASIVTARSLGPVGRGQYYAITTIAAIVAQFGNLGLSSSNTYLAARDPAISWSLVVNGLWICITVAFGAALVVTAVGGALASRLGVSPQLLWAVCVMAPAMLAFTLGSSVLVAHERFAALNLWQIAHALIAMALLVGCALLGAGVAAYVIATALAAVLTII